MEVTQYSSRHCPACEGMKGEMQKLKRAGIKVKLIDCDDSKCEGIQHIPTTILKKGRKSKKIIGFATAEEIKEKFRSL